MTAFIEFFPVGNGDMTLITLESGKRILIDINIRQNADNEKKTDYPNVATMLKEGSLELDTNGRPYVDVFVLTHPDRDHCSGLTTHFHLGSPSTWKTADEDENQTILIREMWSSPLTFRRMDKVDGTLTPNAEAWQKEAKRRVKLFKDGDKNKNQDGNRILILGEDVHHEKTDGLEDIMIQVGQTFQQICGQTDTSFSALLLSPQLVTVEEAETLSGKNNSSIVLLFTITSEKNNQAAKFLTGGDAEVGTWERIWSRNLNDTSKLKYNILQTPHHCSLGVISHDQYNDQGNNKGKGEGCEISVDALKALSQTMDGAFIIASSEEPEKKSGKDLASRVYQNIASKSSGKVFFTMVDSPDKPLKLTITSEGPNSSGKKEKFAPPIPPKIKKGTTERSYA